MVTIRKAPAQTELGLFEFKEPFWLLPWAIVPHRAVRLAALLAIVALIALPGCTSIDPDRISVNMPEAVFTF
jgi:hypothetical protein